MSKNFEEIINAVKEFSLEERARLANILLISLDESSPRPDSPRMNGSMLTAYPMIS